MLKESYTFNGFSTNDLQLTKKFYEETLGLQVVENEMGILEIKAAGSNKFVIYSKENHQPATFTVLNFEVKDIEQEVDDLISKGINFEQYSEPLKTDEKGICRKDDRLAIAWFKDPSGNILSLIQENTRED